MSDLKIIDIIAPASAGDLETFNKSNELLKTLGYQVRYSPNIFSEKVPYSANTDDERLEQLKQAMYAEDSDIIFCARGGYGSQRLIPMLDELEPPSRHKLFVGFSDVTALHLFFTQKWGWQSIHGEVSTELAKFEVQNLPEHIKELLSFLNTNDAKSSVKLTCMNESAKQSSDIQAKVTGGNLTLLETSIGTSWQVNARGKVLVLEDVGEKGYRIDRTLNHLMQTHIIDNCKAVILGDFLPFSDEDKSRLEYALNTFAQDMDKIGVPVFKSTGIGHGDINHPFVENGNVHISHNASNYEAEFSYNGYYLL